MRLSNHLSFGGASTKKVREMFSKDSGNACAKPWEAAGLTIYIYLQYIHVTYEYINNPRKEKIGLTTQLNWFAVFLNYQ